MPVTLTKIDLKHLIETCYDISGQKKSTTKIKKKHNICIISYNIG